MPTTPHTSAILIASGDELLTGQLLDTNTKWLADRLVAMGILPREFIAVPDDLIKLVSTLRRACDTSPLVILTGGLGPTEGDLTRQALAQLLNEPLITDEGSAQAIRAMFEKRNRPVTDRQLRQAQRPQSATSLPNTNGTAPGLHAQVPLSPHSSSPHSSSDLFALPGPPNELRPMFEREVLPRLRPDPSITVQTRLLHAIGLAEADCVDRLGDLTQRTRTPLVGITASGGILTIRIRYEGQASRDHAANAVDETESAIRAILKDHLLPHIPHAQTGAEALAISLLRDLTARKQTLAVVESCTGGMLGETFTAIPGSSSAFRGGYITYSNDLKVNLGVDATTLATHGAVSPQVAQQMATHGLASSNADYCLAITGIAGPDGGTPIKPVGTVHIALATRTTQAHSRHFNFSGNREDIRQRACASAMFVLHFHLRNHPLNTPHLLWQRP